MLYMFIKHKPSYDRNASIFLSIYSNLARPLRFRYNSSYFNEVSSITSSSVHLIPGCSWGDVKNLAAQATLQII